MRRVERVKSQPAGIFLLGLHVSMEAHTQEATAGCGSWLYSTTAVYQSPLSSCPLLTFPLATKALNKRATV